MPLISIIIPIYNVQKYLNACLESVLNQTYKNLEIIFINDGSTDNCLEIVEGYANQDSRIKIVDKPNGGLPSARKAGIEVASGDYIFHLDGDDSLPLDAIENLVNVALSTDADIIVGDYEIKKDESIDKEYISFKIEHPISAKEYREYILQNGIFNIWGKLIRHSLYQNPIDIPLEISNGEDLIHVYQLASFAKSVAPCHLSVYNYYIHDTSMSFDKNIRYSLYDKEIYSHVFLVKFVEDHEGSTNSILLKKFMANFFFNYLLSPHPVSVRRNELKTLISLVDFKTISTYRNPLKFASLCAAKINLDFGKMIVNIAKKFV